MSDESDAPRWGIGVRLPAGDPLAMPHLLGDGWQSIRWFTSAAEREEALENMRLQPVYYRQGDTPSMVLERIDPPAPS